MFPHTITIFGKQNADKSYSSYVIQGVLWYGPEMIVISGKTIQNSDSINVLIPKKAIIKNNLPSDFKIEKGNRIVKGDIKENITSLVELNKHDNGIIVSSVDIKDFGSELDCIIVGGK